MAFGPGYSGPSKIHYLFVDAGSLRGKLDNVRDKFFAGKSYTIEFSALTHGFTKVFYYDAVPVRNDGEDEASYNSRIAPQVAMLDSASNVDRIHVYEGDVRRRRKRNEQKKVDVMIAVDMLTHTFRRNMHEATLLTGDNDFRPLVDALVHDGMFLTLWYPTGETSKELLRAADTRRPLDIRTARSLLTSDSQADFAIPEAITHDPSEEPGTRLKEWHSNGKRCTLNRDGSDYVVLLDHDQLNRFHIRDSNFELLRYFCKDVSGVDVPDL